MEKKTSAAKSSVQFGVLFGVIMILELVISYVMQISPENKTYGTTINVLNFLIFPFAFIYLACTNYKNNMNNGFISFSECIKIGMSIALVATLIYGAFYFIFDIIFPEFVPNLAADIRAITLKENPNLTSEQLDASMSYINAVVKPQWAVLIAIVMNCFIALIHSLIIGAIVKKDPNHSL